MEVNFTPEIEAKLADIAARQGRHPGELVQDVIGRSFEDEQHFVAAVRRGEEALASGEYITHEEVGQRLSRFL